MVDTTTRAARTLLLQYVLLAAMIAFGAACRDASHPPATASHTEPGGNEGEQGATRRAAGMIVPGAGASYPPDVGYEASRGGNVRSGGAGAGDGGVSRAGDAPARERADERGSGRVDGGVNAASARTVVGEVREAAGEPAPAPESKSGRTAGVVGDSATAPGAVSSVVSAPAAGFPVSPAPAAMVRPVESIVPVARETSAVSPVPAAIVRPVAGQVTSRQGAAIAVTRGAATRRSVALTFDAGADRGYAETILDILLYVGAKASFGMTGVWAEQNPDLVRRMADEGHRLINHTYDHGSFTGLSTSRRPLGQTQRWSQLDRTETIITELTGQSTAPLFRSPYGDTDASVLRDIGARGYAYNVLWSVDSRGWLGYSAGAIIRHCLAQAHPGAIYVMHVGSSAQDGPALPAIITGLRDAGYAFETVDEILLP